MVILQSIVTGIIISFLVFIFLLIKFIPEKEEFANFQVKITPKRYHHKDNNANYTLIADFGDEVCLLREDINVRLLFKREHFEKFLKEII